MLLKTIVQDLVEAASKHTVLNLPVFKPNVLKITFQDENDDIISNDPVVPLPFASSELFYAHILSWRRLTSESKDCKVVYEITFDVKNSLFKFHPGDTIGILPQNRESEVNTILECLHLESQADSCFKLSVDNCQKGAKIPAYIPVESTLRHVLSHCVDIRSVVKKLFLLALSLHTKDKTEKNILEYLCSKEGSNAYTTHILNQKLSVVDILTEFKTCQPPIEVLLANLPRLLPRPYSIANSQSIDGNILKICFSVIELDDNKKGLATGFLENIILSDTLENHIENLNINGTGRISQTVPIYLRKNINGFSLPLELEKSLLLIGPGTGVAPFIGFLEERSFLQDKDPSLQYGDIWLFFGCRNPKIDYRYEKELKYFEAKRTLHKLNTSFSRIDNGGIKYVQDAIIQNGEEVSKFILSGATVFVCGDLKTMASQVRDSFKTCLEKYSELSFEEAEKYITEMEKEKRYVSDIWS